MKLGWEWPKNIEFIGAITKDILAGVASPLSNITAGVFANGLPIAIEKINTERTRKEIFKKAKEKAKEKLPALKDKFEKLTPKDLPPTFLCFKDEDEFCPENPALCEKITQEGCKLFYRIIQEEFSRYAHGSDEFWKEFITQLSQDQSREIEEVRKEIEKKGIEQEEFWRNLLEDIERIFKAKPINITSYPEYDSPPDVADFVNRDTEQNNLEELIKRKKHMIIIQGIAGIGKTQIAAKFLENIKNDYITYWKKMRNVSTFDSVIKDPSGLAGFLRDNNDSELADYIEGGGTNHEDIINILLSSLKEKQYALFFDSYQEVENKEVHDLFKRFKDKLTNSTVIITTRELPQFGVDKVKEENVKGFELESARKYLEQKGVEVSEEQLIKLHQKIGGHPLCLKLFASLSLNGKMKIDEIIEKLLKTRSAKRYLLTNIYNKGLSEDEKEVLKALSVFRTAVTADACIPVSKTGNVRDRLDDLSEIKLLVERIEDSDLYYLHDLIREFSYNKIDKPKEYHKRAGEYYCSLEKTPENITETCFHLIKYYDAVNDRIIEYLKGTPQSLDPFTCLTVLNLLSANKIKSSHIFELLDEFVNAPDPNVQNLFISEYGSFFDKIWAINPEKSIEVLRRILDHADSSQLRLFSITVARVAGVSPDEAVKLWKEIIDRGEGDMIVLEYVFNHSTKDTKLGEKAEPVLKYLIGKKEPRISLLAKRELERLEILKPQNYMTCEEHLEKLRNLPTDEKKLSYVTSEFILDDVTISWYLVIEILNNIYKGSPEEVAKLLKLLIKTYYDYNTVFQRTPRLIAKLAIEEDLKYLKFFLDEHENNVYIKYAGIRALDLIKAEIGEDNTNDLLKPLYEDTEPVIRVLANIMKAEMNSSYVTKHTKVELMNPLDTVKFLDADLAPTKETYLYFVMKSWAFLKATEGTDPNIILNMLEPFEDMKPPKTFYKIFIDITQNHPKWTLKIATFLSKSKRSESRSHGLWFLCNAAHLAPEAAIKHLDKVMKRIKENELTSQDVIFFMCCLTDIRGKELREKKEAFFKELSTHQDRNVRGFAKLLLNGV